MCSRELDDLTLTALWQSRNIGESVPRLVRRRFFAALRVVPNSKRRVAQCVKNTLRNGLEGSMSGYKILRIQFGTEGKTPSTNYPRINSCMFDQRALVFRVPACGVNVISRRGGPSRGTIAKCATGCMVNVTVVPDLVLEMLQSLKIDLSNTR